MSSSLTVKDEKGVIIRLAVNGNTLWLCLGLWGVFGEFFCFQPPYKNIWGFSDADSAFLTSSLHFLFLKYMCGGVFFPSSVTDSFSVALAAPLGPLLLTLRRPDVSKQVTTIAHRRGFPPENERELGNVGSWKLTGIPLSKKDMFILSLKFFSLLKRGLCSYSEAHSCFQVSRIEQCWNRAPVQSPWLLACLHVAGALAIATGRAHVGRPYAQTRGAVSGYCFQVPMFRDKEDRYLKSFI